MAVRTVGFINLGNSCFINAGLQAILAVPGLGEAWARGTTSAEKSMARLLADVAASSHAFTPTQITNIYYHGRQEDLTEFLLDLLSECRGCHALLRGTEVPQLRCRHCDYRRLLPAENFLSLHLPLTNVTSVQEALDAYLNKANIQSGVEDWCCLSAGCLDAGVAVNAPTHVSSVDAWPPVLILSLKRWDERRRLLDQTIFCDKELHANDCVYELHALATHIGALPTTGHYVAYRRTTAGFAKFDDTRVSLLKKEDTDYFATTLNEKVYLLVYLKKQAVDENLIQERPRKFARHLASGQIHVDSSESDSDVIMQTQPAGNAGQQPNTAKPSDSPADEADKSHKPDGVVAGSKPLSRFTAKERGEIRDAIQQSTTMKEVVAALATSVPRLTVTDRTAPGYVAYSTLRHWFTKPTTLEKLLSSSSQEHTAGNARAAPQGSLRASLPDAVRVKVAAAIADATSTTDCVSILQKTLPGFSATNRSADHYIPRRTLHNWLTRPAVSEWFHVDQNSEDTWQDEFDRTFSVAMAKPAKHMPTEMNLASEEDEWLRHGAWTFCPACGRRRARAHVTTPSVKAAAVPCNGKCDIDAQALLHPPEQDVLCKKSKLYGYVTPMAHHWEPLLLEMQETGLPLLDYLSKEELQSLAVLDIKVEYRSRRGGNANICTKQKRTVVRGLWKPTPLEELKRSDAGTRAFFWLLANNDTYAAWVHHHAQLARENKDGAPDWREIPTAKLLLDSPGIEIAARPWLYPLASFADTDLSSRLLKLGWITPQQKPSIRAGFLRKLTSRCMDYARDFRLHCLLYDTCMARSISSIISVANQKHIAPEHAAAQQDAFEGYWMLQIRKMEDVCRREYEMTKDMSKALPNVFFTVAPAEWRYVLPEGLMFDDSLTEQQDIITLHLYHTLQALLEKHLLQDGESLAKVGIANIRHWSFRFEFQSRGTLHIHAVLWAELMPGWSSADITARTDKSSSAFLDLLESLFKSRADVQCGDGSHCLMRYVAGYVVKASDALKFQTKQARDDSTQWRQTYRLLCKQAPTEQEIVMEFAGLAMVKHSFSGMDIFAPIPGSKATNSSRRQYAVYQHHLKHEEGGFGDGRSLSFIQWLRIYQIIGSDPEDMAIRRRNGSGPAANKACGVAIAFPFELLDIYVGAWAASCLPGMLEERLFPEVPSDLRIQHFDNELARRRSFVAPVNCQHLKAVLSLDEFQLDGADPEVYSPDVGKFFGFIEPELTLRGLSKDRISTFKAKVEATNLLLLQIRDGNEDAGFWSAQRLPGFPLRQWSPEQQEVLDFVKEGLSASDAATVAGATRILQVSGSPGTGKTEVVIAAANMALIDDCKVLIAGPIGLLVAMYRLRLPASDNLTMETIHSAFQLTREADKAYIPPGRLRRYDLIIMDEVSQIDGTVWEMLKLALSELRPGPLIIFVGDFQQLQPIRGPPQLRIDLEAEVEAGTVRHIRLRHHDRARSVDPDMLEFLTKIRCEQPSRACLEAFFSNRVWPKEPGHATRKAMEVEHVTGKPFMFLTVTNKPAHDLNEARIAAEFPREAELLRRGGGIPAEHGNIIVVPGMKVRLTYNVSKDNGFVNGNTGTVRLVLRQDVFVLETRQHTSVLVYPITLRGRKFLPVSYGYATTMRRAQGGTMDNIGLYFDRPLPDRGYAYVGTSRAKARSNVFHLGKIRRTDWLPVGQPRAEEQTKLSVCSESTDEEEEESSDPESISETEPSSGDFSSQSESWS